MNICKHPGVPMYAYAYNEHRQEHRQKDPPNSSWKILKRYFYFKNSCSFFYSKYFQITLLRYFMCMDFEFFVQNKF